MLLIPNSCCRNHRFKPQLALMAKPKMVSARKSHTTSPIHFWPAVHLRDAVKREAINSGRTITGIMEELLAQRYKLPLRLSGAIRSEVPK